MTFSFLFSFSSVLWKIFLIFPSYHNLIFVPLQITSPNANFDPVILLIFFAVLVYCTQFCFDFNFIMNLFMLCFILILR